MDPDGKNCELFAAGFRNAYDIAFNSDGELFGFDSDMEWDWGTPWYRPTRVNHVPAGAELGWRSGWTKWPEYFIDSLPGTLDIGPGSPTGVVFYDHVMFPVRLQNTLFLAFWAAAVSVPLAILLGLIAVRYRNGFVDKTISGLALASTLLWALYWLLNARDHRPPLVAQWQNFSVGVPVLTLLLLVGPGVAWHGWAGLGAGVYVGLFEMGIAFVLWQLAVHKVSRTAKVSNLIFLSPPVSLVLLFFIVGEPILPSTLVGLVLILGGLGLQQWQKAPAPASAQ